jgi:hypothetical protein
VAISLTVIPDAASRHAGRLLSARVRLEPAGGLSAAPATTAPVAPASRAPTSSTCQHPSSRRASPPAAPWSLRRADEEERSCARRPGARDGCRVGVDAQAEALGNPRELVVLGHQRLELASVQPGVLVSALRQQFAEVGPASIATDPAHGSFDCRLASKGCANPHVRWQTGGRQFARRTRPFLIRSAPPKSSRYAPRIIRLEITQRPGNWHQFSTAVDHSVRNLV